MLHERGRDELEADLRRAERARRRADALLNAVIPIGVALSSGADLNELLERILLEARTFCSADAGTLYLRTDHHLTFAMMRTESLGLALGGTTGHPIPFDPLPLHDAATGAPNHRNVATYSALTGAAVNITDAYETGAFDFSGTRAFDARTGYRSRSFLTVPLRDSAGRVIGVLQLINALDPDTGAVIPFDAELEAMTGTLSTLATVALQAYLREDSLRRQVAELRIEVDRAKQARQVAEITETDYFQQLQDKARRLRSAGGG
jgi:GAF domain-containing protein